MCSTTQRLVGVQHHVERLVGADVNRRPPAVAIHHEDGVPERLLGQPQLAAPARRIEERLAPQISGVVLGEAVEPQPLVAEPGPDAPRVQHRLEAIFLARIQLQPDTHTHRQRALAPEIEVGEHHVRMDLQLADAGEPHRVLLGRDGLNDPLLFVERRRRHDLRRQVEDGRGRSAEDAGRLARRVAHDGHLVHVARVGGHAERRQRRAVHERAAAALVHDGRMVRRGLVELAARRRALLGESRGVPPRRREDRAALRRRRRRAAHAVQQLGQRSHVLHADAALRHQRDVVLVAVIVDEAGHDGAAAEIDPARRGARERGDVRRRSNRDETIAPHRERFRDR
jgi:hypothetical protein